MLRDGIWSSPDAILISSFRLREGSVRHTGCPASRHNSRRTFAILATALAVPYSREQSVPAFSANPTPVEQPYIGRANFLVGWGTWDSSLGRSTPRSPQIYCHNAVQSVQY